MPETSEHSRATIDHDTIKEWVEDRGGKPATVAETATGSEPGILRLQFPDTENDHDRIELIDWDDFFGKFEQANLALVYQDETESGNTSRFYKFVDRATVGEI